MRVVAFQNQKGGVGKSTLSLLVAEQLSQSGREGIFLDNDPQGNSTQWFLNRLTDADYPLILEELQSKNLYNLLQERITPQNSLLELPDTTVQLLAATLCDVVVIPVQTEMFAVETLPIQLERIRTARKYLNPELKQVYLLPNLFDTRLKSCHYALDYLVEHYRDKLIFQEDQHPLWIPKRAEIMGFIDSHEPVRSNEMTSRLQVLVQALFPEFS